MKGKGIQALLCAVLLALTALIGGQKPVNGEEALSVDTEGGRAI